MQDVLRKPALLDLVFLIKPLRYAQLIHKLFAAIVACIFYISEALIAQGLEVDFLIVFFEACHL